MRQILVYCLLISIIAGDFAFAKNSPRRAKTTSLSREAALSRLDLKQQVLRESVAKLIEKSLTGNVSLLALLTSFHTKPGKRTDKFFQSKERMGSFPTMRAGSIVAFGKNKNTHIISIDSVYPDLSISVDGARITPTANEKLDDWAAKFLSRPLPAAATTSASAASHVSWMNWLLPSAFADLESFAAAVMTPVGLGATGLIGGAIFGVAGLVQQNRSINATNRLTGATNRVANATEQATTQLKDIAESSAVTARTLEEINGDLAHMTRLQEQLNSVQIPNAELQLAEGLRRAGNNAEAEGLTEAARASAQQALHSLYGPTLNSLENLVRRADASDRISCRSREGNQTYAEYATKVNGSVLNLKRTQRSLGMDQVTLSVGDLSLSQLDITPPSMSQFHPLLARTENLRICSPKNSNTCETSDLANDNSGSSLQKMNAVLASQAFSSGATSDLALNNQFFSSHADNLQALQIQAEALVTEGNDFASTGAEFLRCRDAVFLKAEKSRGQCPDSLYDSLNEESSTREMATAVDAVVAVYHTERIPSVSQDSCASALAAAVRSFHKSGKYCNLRILSTRNWNEAVEHFHLAGDLDFQVNNMAAFNAAKFNAQQARDTVVQMRGIISDFAALQARIRANPRDPEIASTGIKLLGNYHTAKARLLALGGEKDHDRMAALLNDSGLSAMAEALQKGLTTTVALAEKLNDFSNLSSCCSSKYCSGQINRFLDDRRMASQLNSGEQNARSQTAPANTAQ